MGCSIRRNGFTNQRLERGFGITAPRSDPDAGRHWRTAGGRTEGRAREQCPASDLGLDTLRESARDASHHPRARLRRTRGPLRIASAVHPSSPSEARDREHRRDTLGEPSNHVASDTSGSNDEGERAWCYSAGTRAILAATGKGRRPVQSIPESRCGAPQRQGLPSGFCVVGARSGSSTNCLNARRSSAARWVKPLLASFRVRMPGRSGSSSDIGSRPIVLRRVVDKSEGRRCQGDRLVSIAARRRRNRHSASTFPMA